MVASSSSSKGYSTLISFKFPPSAYCFSIQTGMGYQYSRSETLVWLCFSPPRQKSWQCVRGDWLTHLPQGTRKSSSSSANEGHIVETDVPFSVAAWGVCDWHLNQCHPLASSSRSNGSEWARHNMYTAVLSFVNRGVGGWQVDVERSG